MLEISSFKIENMESGYVTDETNPRFSWSVSSERNETEIKKAVLAVNGWSVTTLEQAATAYAGPTLKPFSKYRAEIAVYTEDGEKAGASLDFETGFLGEAFTGKWITDGGYLFKESRVSPIPMVFRKKAMLEKKIVEARLYATAIGIYRFSCNGKRVGRDYFTPGFTSYKYNLQYQTYDITDLLYEGENLLVCTVTGGWAVGSFGFTRKNRITANRQALLAEMRVKYEDGTEEIIPTDESWEVTLSGRLRSADLYDGEEYDASISDSTIIFHGTSEEKVKADPVIKAAYGVPVRSHEEFEPKSVAEVGDEIIYDFGQNFAGIVRMRIDGRKGETITVRHAEILKNDGTLNTDFLRTAKARIVYVCKEGKQEYSPNFTYMGFRYVSVTGIPKDRIDIKALALYSSVEETGEFSCSHEMLNRLQENIKWGAKSNFMEIPTDCPQRDERMGWTGDIALFAPTACFNFNMESFLEKWLRDMRAEQIPTGGIPNTVPSQGFGFPVTMPFMAVDFWGDASVLVPWALYRKNGDKKILSDNYDMMKKYVKACKRWAGLLSFGDRRYIWNTLHTLHFGDWVAPDVPLMSDWQKRSKWTATASLANTSRILSKIARILGKEEDTEYFEKIYVRTSKAYINVFTDKKGKLLKEFQTAYVLPIYFGMFDEKTVKTAAANLAEMVKRSDHTIGTGFPGTPYILFALADNGQKETAFKMLLNTKCPSWLYEVKTGATTIWERWDGLDENGNCPIGDDGTDSMISYNHYASGAVGDFLYRRVAGIEALEAGYRQFKIEPVTGGGLTEAKAKLICPYGVIASEWKIEDNIFSIKVQIPVGSECKLIMPDKEIHRLKNGKYEFSSLL